MKKAPPVPHIVLAEAYPFACVSDLVYGLGHLVKAIRGGDIVLKFPDGNPIPENLGTLDFRRPGWNNEDGISYAELFDILDANKDVIEANFEPSFEQEILAGMKEHFATEYGKGAEKETFLATYRSFQEQIACVYGVIKDRLHKVITVVFRGSLKTLSNRDWPTNFNYRLKSMETPEKIKHKMKGRVKNRVLVHKGFYEYLFENDRMENDYQRFDNIIDDIRPLMEEGYSLYITGHSLGGALAHLFTFKLAGAGGKYDWVPRPLTCITFGAPMQGTGGYRAAYEQMEKDNLIRCLRVVNVEDPVPALLPISLGLSNFRFMKHTGINLRLSKSGISLQHSSKANFVTAARNSLFKPCWMKLKCFSDPDSHSLKLSVIRLAYNFKLEDLKLEDLKLDDLYKDENYVSAKFLAGEVSEYSSEE